MSEQTLAADPLAVAQGYHQRSKHRLERYAAGPETLDWDAQPDPFRVYVGAEQTALPLLADQLSTPWSALFEPRGIVPRLFDLQSIALLWELSLGLSAWKQSGPDRWAVRVNPSSGNLHPTEGWLLCQGLPDVADGVHHYLPREHALEQRAAWARANTDTPRVWIALSSIAWREAWKYGERAFRYCQLDTGHAIAALRYAAALLGWQLQAVPCSCTQLATLLGLDRTDDFGKAERDEAEALFALVPNGSSPSAMEWPAASAWFGTPNSLDKHPMYRWPVIDAVAQATRRVAASAPSAAVAQSAHAPTLPPLQHSAVKAATLIRQRRSAQRFDARARMPLEQLWPLLRALHSSRLPFDASPARVHVLLFAHRVDGLAAGAYLLPRSASGAALLRQALPHTLDLRPVLGAPDDAPLLLLSENPALAASLRTLNCHQALGSDAILGFALLAEFHPLPDAHAYRLRLQEAGSIGQVLYLEAESQGLRGTGIGCFFDDALHQMLGLHEAAASASLQSVYHFTVGRAVEDARITTEPPYAHLLPPTEGAPHG